MEPYLLIVYLAMKPGDVPTPPPQMFECPSRADCLREADRIHRLNLGQAICVPKNRLTVIAG
jgi:hypothetical protein